MSWSFLLYKNQNNKCTSHLQGLSQGYHHQAMALRGPGLLVFIAEIIIEFELLL
jgi:hypothetical protein